MVVNYILNLIIIPGLLIWIEVNLQENRINRIVKSVSLRSAHEDDDRGHSHSGRIEKFFKLQLNDFIGNFKYAILALFVLWTTYMVIIVGRFSRVSGRINFLKDDDIL